MAEPIFIGLGNKLGTWNATSNSGSLDAGSSASTPTTTLFVSGDSSTTAGRYNNTTKLTASVGDYWQVTTAGTFNVDGYSQWQLNDYCVFVTGTAGNSWRRLSYTDTVSSLIVGQIEAEPLANTLISGSSALGPHADNKMILFVSGAVADQSASFSGSYNFVRDYTTGYTGIGTSDPSSTLHAAYVGSTAWEPGTVIQRSHDTPATGPALWLARSRGKINSESNVSDSDQLGRIVWAPYYGDFRNEAASITVHVDGTPGSDDTPGKMYFGTTAAGENTTTNRMVIEPEGNIGINHTNPAHILDVLGDTAITGSTATKTTDCALKVRKVTKTDSSEALNLQLIADNNGTPTGSIAGGVGTSISHTVRTTAGGNFEHGGFHKCYATSVTPGAETFAMQWGVMTTGSAAFTAMTLNRGGFGSTTLALSQGDQSYGFNHNVTLQANSDGRCTISATGHKINLLNNAATANMAACVVADYDAGLTFVNRAATSDHEAITIGVDYSDSNKLKFVSGSLSNLGDNTKNRLEISDSGVIVNFGQQAIDFVVRSSTSTQQLYVGSNGVGVAQENKGNTLDVNGKMSVTGSLMPGADNTHDLGSNSFRWANIYTGDLHLKNERGDWTVVEEESFLCIINNKTGKKYKMLMEEID